ncbi:MAG: class I SAM-dependent methyltransferase [Candidatus Omnitrophota bacterium]
MIRKLKEKIRQCLPHRALESYRFLQRLHFELNRSQIYRGSEIRKIVKENWKNYKYELYPKDRRMSVIREKQIEGMCTENISFMINEIVRRFAKAGVYLEVGSYKGYSLISAALFNQSTRCIGIDNFSEFDEKHKNKSILMENLKKFDVIKNVEFYNCDYIEAFRAISQREPGFKINVYYYDGGHSYEEQVKGLDLALPFLSKRCVIIVDDLNISPQVEGANRHFISKNPGFKSVFRIKTTGPFTPEWLDGFEIITRGV